MRLVSSTTLRGEIVQRSKCSPQHRQPSLTADSTILSAQNILYVVYMYQIISTKKTYPVRNVVGCTSTQITPPRAPQARSPSVQTQAPGKIPCSIPYATDMVEGPSRACLNQAMLEATASKSREAGRST